MLNILKLAVRNLKRYKRRTFLTSMLITMGVVAVLLFISVSGSFKTMMVGQITDSMLGHIQIHKKGYLASIDSLPLDRNLKGSQLSKVKEILDSTSEVEAYSMRIRLGAMFSNFKETTNIRLNAVNPKQEIQTVPMLLDRIIKGKKEGLLVKGEILVPELIAKGLEVKINDTIVLVATNKDGSVDLYLQNENPGLEKEANWLPAPKGSFIPMLRLYWPKESPPCIIDGTWKVPAIQQVM